jgi:hypothetical protein
MSETQEHKGNTESKLFQESYRNDRQAYIEIVEDKFNDIITIQKLLNKYGDRKLSDLLENVQGRYDMARELLDDFCKEENEAISALEKKYKPGELVALTCKSRDIVDLAIKYLKGEI